MVTKLHLEPVTRENVEAACELKVRPRQKGYVAPVSWSLAEAYAAPEIAWPRLIYKAGKLVGFIMAAFDPQNPNKLYHSYLWRLNIGAKFQGRGYGRFAVERLYQGAQRRGESRLTVSYDLGKHGPAGFSQRLGFRAVLAEIIGDGQP